MFEYNSTKTYARNQFRIRVLVATLLVLACFALLVYRLLVLQVDRHQGLSERAERNRILLVPIPPKRGDIYDRNGQLLAHSYRDYTLEVTPGKVGAINDTIAEIAKIITLSDLDIRRFRQRMGANTKFSSVMLRGNITDDEAARFAVRSFQFPGVRLRARWVREYAQGESAAHVIGYVGRISEKDQEKLEAKGIEGNYRGTEVIGKKGLEASYEKILHGKTGWEEVEVSASGRPVRVLKHIEPIPGDDLRLSIDMGLQHLIEGIYNNAKNPLKGAFVAIDPRNGQVLAYVSAPSFDPNLFIDGIDVENWRRLADSPDHPLLDRVLSSTFPVGSTYKPFVALAALKLGVRDPNARIPDPGYFEFAGQRFHNAGRAVYGPTTMHNAIMVSSDTYFFGLGQLIGVDNLHDFAIQFGFGKQTGIDLLYEKKGVLPSRQWKQDAFKSPNMKKWFPGDTISLAVGQGYNAFTILQLAQAISTLAANAVYTRPHLVNTRENLVLHKSKPVVTTPDYQIDIRPKDLKIVQDALHDVVARGTARKVFQGAKYSAAGKTGTAQVFNLKGQRYSAKNLHKRLHDHALFAGYAPFDNPQIAVALIVENGGWGGTVAAPIARAAFDYWLAPERQNIVESQPNFLDLKDNESDDEEDGASPDVHVPEVPSNPDDNVSESLPEILQKSSATDDKKTLSNSKARILDMLSDGLKPSNQLAVPAHKESKGK